MVFWKPKQTWPLHSITYSNYLVEREYFATEEDLF